MSKQTINIGASPNDGTGTPLRTSFDYTNQNFTELYTALGGGVGLPGATTQVIFNDGGTNLAGDAGLVYNKTTDALTVGGNVQASSATITGDLTVRTNKLLVTATGVGVGAAPVNPFDVTSTSGTLSVFKRTGSNGAFIGIEDGSGAGLAYLGVTNGTFSIQTPGSGYSDKLSVDTSGNVSISTGNLVMTTSGKGIDFSATAGTGTSELLNDYEEGTWTPVVADAATGGNVGTCVIGHATYTKIGRQVSVECYINTINTTGMTGANSFRIRGLPFATVKGGNGNFYTYRVGRNASTASSSAFASDGGSSVYFPIFTTNSGTADLAILVSDITSGVSEFIVSVTYSV